MASALLLTIGIFNCTKRWSSVQCTSSIPFWTTASGLAASRIFSIRNLCCRISFRSFASAAFSSVSAANFLCSASIANFITFCLGRPFPHFCLVSQFFHFCLDGRLALFCSSLASLSSLRCVCLSPQSANRRSWTYFSCTLVLDLSLESLSRFPSDLVRK